MRLCPVRPVVLLAAAALSVFGVGPAQAVTITFSGLAHGEIVGTDFAAQGIADIVTTNLGGGPNLGIVFDTERDPAVEVNDDDLLRKNDGWDAGNLASTTVLGNALIIQENSTGCAAGNLPGSAGDVCDDPDDEGTRAAGRFEIFFTGPIPGLGFDLIDVEDARTEFGSITFFNGAVMGNTITWLQLAAMDATIAYGDNSANRISPLVPADTGLAEFNRVRIILGGSGAVDNLELPFIPTPEPSALLLWASTAAALAGITMAGRRPGS
jgi:hypothetical protein